VTASMSHLSDDDIRAVADPMRRGQILREISIERKTLTASQSAIWTATIAELAGEDLNERKPTWIARKLGIDPSRVRQIRLRAKALQRAAGVTGSNPRGARRNTVPATEGAPS
jgi:hypothetical protein